MITRRNFLYSGAAALVGSAGLGADGYLESYRLELKKIEVSLPRLPRAFDGFTIVQLSDFHYEEDFSAVPIRRSVELINNLVPDVVVFTGDFVTAPILMPRRHAYHHSASSAFPCAQILSRINSRVGKFAVLGNHDVYENPALVTSALHAHHIPVLKNISVPIEKDGARFWLAGVDDAMEGAPDLGAALENIPRDEATILLAHEPDFADEAALTRVDLQLSGHSHGGQIWIPGIGAPWLPELARKYPRGLYNIGKLKLYTNIGIGTIRAPIRINCVPEVTLITLRSAVANKG